MRILVHSLATAALIVTLSGCVEPAAPVTSTTAQAPRASAELTFPSEAEIAAGRSIPIRLGTMIGTHGPIDEMFTGADACGTIRELGGRRFTMAYLDGDGRRIGLGFNVSNERPCPREVSSTGLRYEYMTRIVALQDGRYITSSPAMTCVFTVMAYRCRAHQS